MRGHIGSMSTETMHTPRRLSSSTLRSWRRALLASCPKGWGVSPRATDERSRVWRHGFASWKGRVWRHGCASRALLPLVSREADLRPEDCWTWHYLTLQGCVSRQGKVGSDSEGSPETADEAASGASRALRVLCSHCTRQVCLKLGRERPRGQVMVSMDELACVEETWSEKETQSSQVRTGPGMSMMHPAVCRRPGCLQHPD